MGAIILLLATLGVCLAAPPNNEVTIQYRPTVGGKIVGGVETTIANFPWQVAILRGGQQICGGSLVAPRVVLTAAHCVANSVIPRISLLSIRSGSTQQNSGGTVVAASRKVVHAQYQDCDGCSPDYDIAAIHLASNANLGAARVVALWDAGTVFAAGTIGIISGWGATSEGGAGSVNLRRVEVPIVHNDQCRKVYGSIISSRTVCAGYPQGGKDSCQGDSGGPFVVGGRLYGVVSFGTGCARPNIPGVYSSIPGYRSWIRTNAGV